MFEGPRLSGFRSLLALATCCWLNACTPTPPAASEQPAGGTGGSGGARPGMSGMAGAMADGGSSPRDAASAPGTSMRQDASTTPRPDVGLPPADASASDVASSAMGVFAVCAVCHGAEGQGIPDKGPEIQHPIIDF